MFRLFVCVFQEHDCISLIFVTGKCALQAPSILQLVKRSGQEVPSLLSDMAEVAGEVSRLVFEDSYQDIRRGSREKM